MTITLSNNEGIDCESQTGCDIAFVGGGFRTTTFLASAPELLQTRIRVIERGSLIGPGAFADYAVTSTSVGSRFLRGVSLDTAAASTLQMPHVAALSRAEHPVPLDQVAGALTEIGSMLTTALGANQVLLNTEVLSIDVSSKGQSVVLTTARGPATTARHVVIATGRRERLHPELDQWRSKVLLSNTVIRQSWREELERNMIDLAGGPVVIAGCSHSAMSALGTLLTIRQKLNLPNLEIKVLQRGPARLMYESLKYAVAQHVPDREILARPDRDVCPDTGIVFRDSGLRHESKDLYCALWNGDIDRVGLVRATLQDADPIFREAGLIVQALGYHGEVPNINVDGHLVRSRYSPDRFKADDHGAVIMGNRKMAVLSVLRVEPTPIDQRDNAVYGAGLYKNLARRLSGQFGLASGTGPSI